MRVYIRRKVLAAPATRAELDKLMSQYKGPIKQCPAQLSPEQVVGGDYVFRLGSKDGCRNVK